MNYHNRWIATLLLAMALAGCAGLRPADTEPLRNHMLDAQLEPASQPHPLPLTLLISAPRAAPGFDTPRMAYVRHPNVLEYFAQNQWADTPARMLWPLLVRAMEQKTGFNAAVPASGLVKGDIRLDTEIIQIQQEFTSSPSRMHITLRAQLVEQTHYRVLAARTFEVFENADKDDPDGGAAAANRAIGKLIGEVLDFSVVNGKRYFEGKKIK
ncbi:MAG: ABC-type transport auxiliary lipoprotein family protein [Sulfuricella sp.]|nr:ABC-type transport auxiliary lipoprotein family protein [Sulfuricella sp.]